MKSSALRGKQALESLAARFPQLYVAPAEDASEAHRRAAGRGMAPEGANLSHFVGSEEDELREVQTPAGPIEVLFLKRRADFETFLQIVGHRSQPEPIAPSIGAITYLGLADWGKVAAAYQSYVSLGGDDWASEFARLARDGKTFRSELIVISEGSYSNIPADKIPYDAETWLVVSREIRLHHECAHVVCRRLMPENVLPVWDEITADTCGLMCAIDRYDAELAALFLGVDQHGFFGGRLEEYLDAEQRQDIDALAQEVYAALMHIQELSRGRSDPFEFLLELKCAPLIGF